MKQLAEQIGVSQPLISMVLNDRWRENRISEQTRERVLKKLEQLNFRPNRLATSLRNKRTDTVGILVPNIRGEMYHEILGGVETAMAADFNIHLGVSEYDLVRERGLIVSFLERRVDGLIWVLADTEQEQPLLHEIARKKIPLVLVDRRHREARTSYVGSNHTKTGRIAAEHLLTMGYRHLVFVSHLPHARLRNTMLSDRLIAFEAAAKKAGATFEVFEVNPADHGNDLVKCGRVVAEHLRSVSAPSGLHVMQPTIAASVAVSCRNIGIDVPQQVGVLAVEGTPDNELLVVPLSVMRQSLRKIGNTAGEILRGMIDGTIPPDQIEQVELDVELVPNRSTQRV